MSVSLVSPDRTYIDMGGPDWRAIEIDADGWRVVDEPPIRFRRAPGMLPLPMPMGAGSLDALRNFLNVQQDRHFILAICWLLVDQI